MLAYKITGKYAPRAMLFGLLVVCGSVFAAPQADLQEAAKETMFSLLRKGGPIMIPLGIASIVALAITIERLLSLRRVKLVPPDFMEGLKAAAEGEDASVSCLKYCDDTDAPIGAILKAGILRLSRGEAAVEKAVEDAGYREALKMKRSLRVLSIIASVSPLLGLLGTVYGMIAAFQTASSVGMGKADVLAKGIYEALVTTATGLTIAIPVLLMFQFLSAKVDAIVDDLDEMVTEFTLTFIGSKDRE